MGITSEKTFEEAIEQNLISNGGYEIGKASDFDKEFALDIPKLICFLKTTQQKEWDKLEKVHGNSIDKKVIQRLAKELDTRSSLDVLRHGFIDFGSRFNLAYFKPDTKLNPETEELYRQNILSVTRQVKYSQTSENSLDMVLFVNGIPIATIELKNQFTGQDVSQAKKQYAYDRDQHELLFQFKKRTLVHFVVDTDEVYMTTKLDGNKTKFIPFNKGHENGAGNPTNPNGYKTSYLWEEVLKKDSWLEIIGRFVHIQVEEIKIDSTKIKKETIIFPRYHQLDAVRKLSHDTKSKGSGKNYLIQHSAGSGKSNTIAWLAYRLSSLHDNEDSRIFHSVVVITDRKVLDRQLQNTIYQFEHKQGVVQKVDKNSAQLAESLESGTPIIITTLQKFPFILDKIGVLPNRKYAVIVDEAHSSQGGEATKKMKQILVAKSLEDAEQSEMVKAYKGDTECDYEDEIRKSMQARGKQPNLSFFAFTATPKPKTLEVFGDVEYSPLRLDDKSRVIPRPSHMYSMKQAIEEGFIIDVLKNYMTYKAYFKLSKQIEDNPELNKKKATRAIARFMSLHPHNLAQKTEVIIEHFRLVTSKKIGGKAKAMVVTSSRLHAVRYKQEFDLYIKNKGYTDIKTLVAFSGKVIDEFANEFTEMGMNGFGEKELTTKFDTSEYQVLIVADKYQTGFDQPLLHTMYVDKKLSGVKAVQTISRLNRTCAGKEDTFVLDFINETEDIINSFQPYYELTTVKETTDPNHLYDLKRKLDEKQLYLQSEIESFCKVFFKKLQEQTIKDHARLNAFIDPAVERFKNLEIEQERDDFKNNLTVFLRLYSFLSQVMPFQDIELEKFYGYGKLLLNKLPKTVLSDRFKLNDEVALQYYRLQKTSEILTLTLEDQKEYGLDSLKEAGLRNANDQKAKLTEIIEVLNEKFGTEFADADRLFFDQIEQELVADIKLQQQAQSNSKENFKFGFEEIFLKKLIERMEQNEEIFKRIMDDNAFAAIIKEHMLNTVYQRINAQ
ncbi:MAG: type I restriction endonuclease [Bacteroidota bacterium]